MEELSHDLRKALTSYCMQEITKKEESPDLQQAASKVIVIIGVKFHNEVMDKLFTKFQPGSIPGYYVIKTVADLSSATPFGMVPYIKALIGTMLPMLSIAKTDSSKRVFAYCLARFAESIQEYLANIDKAPDTGVNKEYFSYEMGAAFDVLFNQWFQTRDTRVREQVVEALGFMSSLLSQTKMEELAHKVINAYLLLYSKGRQTIASAMSGREFQLFIATQSFCQILESCLAVSGKVVLPLVEDIVSTLFTQVCALVDYSQPSSIRNHNELLRCFTTLTRTYSDIVIANVLQKFENTSASCRAGALSILKHLINACTENVQTKLPSIFFALRLVLSDENNKVKKLVAQVIVAIAHHGYLDMDGGTALVHFVIRQCALPCGSDTSRRLSIIDAEDATNESLKTMCENVMHLLVTTVENVETVLWPLLFEFVISPELSLALPVIYKSLAHMGEKLSSDPSAPPLSIDYKNNALPTPPALLARLCVTIGHKPNVPATAPGLQFMKIGSSLIDSNLRPLWDTMIPQFIESADVTPVNGDLNVWQTKWLAFVNQTLIEVDNSEFDRQFGKALISHIHLYSDLPESKNFLLFLLGNVIRRLASKAFTVEAIDAMVAGANHSNELERIGVAYAMGQASASNLDAVLVKLEHFAEAKRGSSFLGLIMDSVRASDQDREKLRATVMLSYGQACKYAPPDLLMTRIESPIIRTMAAYYQSSKDPLIKKSFLQSVKVVADSVHSDSLNIPFILRSRNELLHEMISVLKTSPLTEQHVLLAVDAIAALVKLDPQLGTAEKTNIIEVTAKVTLSSYNNDVLLKSMQNLMLQLIKRDQYATGSFELIIRSLYKWLASRYEHERSNAIEVLSFFLRTYLEGIPSDNYCTFEPLAYLLAIFAPRALDPVIHVRYKAFECLRTSCLISNKLHCRSEEDDDMSIKSLDLAEKCGNEDPASIENTCDKLARFLSQRLAQDNCALIGLLLNLGESLTDAQPESSRAACLLMTALFVTRAEDLKPDVTTLISMFHKKIPIIPFEETRVQVGIALKVLAKHHKTVFVSALLQFNLPFDDVLTGIWRVLAADSDLTLLLVQVFLDILSDNNVVRFQADQPSLKKSLPVATHKSLAAICALREVLSSSVSELVAKSLYDQLFPALLLTIASYTDSIYISLGSPSSRDARDSRRESKSSNSSAKISPTFQPPAQDLKPVLYAIEAFKSLLVSAGQGALLAETNQKLWSDLEDEISFPEAISTIGREMCVRFPNHVPALIAKLIKAAGSESSNKRLVVVTLFSEFVAYRFKDDGSFSEPLINVMLNALNDPTPVVRRMAIRGISRIGAVHVELVSVIRKPRTQPSFDVVLLRSRSSRA